MTVIPRSLWELVDLTSRFPMWCGGVWCDRRLNLIVRHLLMFSDILHSEHHDLSLFLSSCDLHVFEYIKILMSLVSSA